MKELNEQATAIFLRLIDGLSQPGDNRKLDNAPGAYIALCVEIVDRTPRGPIVSLAHYGEQNGDLMRDPDVTFLVMEQSGNKVWPLSYRNDYAGVDEEYVDLGPPIRCDLKGQFGLTQFCEGWLENIVEQQGV